MALVLGEGATELVLCFVFQASLVQAHGLIIPHYTARALPALCRNLGMNACPPSP